MKTITKEVMECVSNGKRFNIDFGKRNIKIGNRYLMKEGDYNKEKYKLCEVDNTVDDILFQIECLYKMYKYSTPSERSEKKRRKYFKALPVDEMTDEQLIAGVRRDVAQAVLESFVLCKIVNGNLYWDENIMKGKWFWESQNDSDLILLRKWIEE